jgi:dihydrofolate reductase
MAENRVIGRADALPWHLPRDMRRFKRLTTGHAVIMGRRTFETLPAPLPDRRNVVLTRDPSYRRSGIEVVHTLDAALALVAGAQEVFVAGGAEVYRGALPVADRIHLTVVHATVDGDTFFPEITMEAWRLVEDLRFETDERHAFACSFRRYERRTHRS